MSSSRANSWGSRACGTNGDCVVVLRECAAVILVITRGVPWAVVAALVDARLLGDAVPRSCGGL